LIKGWVVRKIGGVHSCEWGKNVQAAAVSSHHTTKAPARAILTLPTGAFAPFMEALKNGLAPERRRLRI
jgi:hypothetical protein